MGSSSGIGPTCLEGDRIVFRLADPQHELRDVKVWFDVDLGVELAMARVEAGWELRLELPDLDCLEYLFDADGSMAPDPGNPDRVDGAFGPHSWLALPGYRPPAWLDQPAAPGERHRLAAAGVEVEVWEPAGHTGESLPLLLVHDGAEMDAYGRLLQYAGTRPPMRVALLGPGADRDERYAANPAYAAALVDDVLPELAASFATADRPVLLGQSLGALAALHAAWTSPGTFAGLMLQSGSFFTHDLDPQESGYGYFAQVTGFITTVLDARSAAAPPPYVAMTCGTAEENLGNNVLMRDHLRAIGVPVTWGEVRQGHTWTCWRDTLDPHLTELLRSVWGH
jgi:enterochelin esterase family protein